MILCLCHGVSDRSVHQLIDEGAKDLREIGRSCGAGTDCGSCLTDVYRLLRERREQAPPAQAAAAK